MFDFFPLGARAYARRAENLLREARFAQLEHEAAAEHHGALARMYADRVLRLEGARRDSLRRDKAPTLAGEVAPADLPRAERAPLRVLSPAGSAVQPQQQSLG